MSLQGYMYNPLGNDGVKNPKGVIYTYKLWCDSAGCNYNVPVAIKNEKAQWSLRIEVPTGWTVYHPGTYTERTICPKCTKKGLK